MPALVFGDDLRMFALVAVPVQAAAYTAAGNQFVPLDTTAAAVTVTLPPAPMDQALVGVKIVAGGNAATISCAGSDRINTAGGSTAVTLSASAGQGLVLQYEAALAVWYVIMNSGASILPGGTAAAGSELVATGISTTQWISTDFNVLAFGAKGDGATDDTAAIQAAITAAAGGEVVLPPTAGGYLLNSAAGLSLATAGTVLRGGGAEATKILIGPAFTGTAAVSITAYNCQIKDLSINGASSTTTSNPAANAIEITGVRRAKVLRCTFFNVNGWCIEAAATSGSSTTNPFGTQIGNLCISSCAGGLRFLGNTVQGYAVNSLVSNVHIASGGVSSGASANLDGIRIEDAWDVLIENAISWTTNGTGSSLHVKGNSAASFVSNLDALGPSGGPCVLIEDGVNGSPQNTQISGGVIQQGSPGILISGAAKQIHINTSRIINNTTHGITVSGTGTTIYLNELFFSLNGAGAAGTNYDINWSGSALGYVSNARFASSIVATGTAGVQFSVNMAAAGQAVRFIHPQFLGSGAASTNWFTNLPSALVEVSSGAFDFVTGFIAKGNAALQPAAAGNTVVSGNVLGSDAFDRFRLTGDGALAIGSGSAARDTAVGRSAAGVYSVTTGSMSVTTAGQGLRVKEGTNAKQGTGTLAAGTVTVANTSVTASSRILLTSNSDGGTPGWLRVSARVAGTSFTITSSSASDTSTVAYQIFEPG